MQVTPRAVSTSPNAAKPETAGARPVVIEDAIYRVVTVGAILMLLGSLWIF